jgi:hypothetical protein
MKDEALKLALEALETELAVDMTNGAEVGEAAELMCEAITAIKQALAAPVQDSTCNNALREQGKAYPRTCKKCKFGPCIALANAALDKKAENARDLGLDYEPHKGLSEHLAQATNGRVRIDPVTGDVGIGTPPAQPAPVQATMKLESSGPGYGPAPKQKLSVRHVSLIDEGKTSAQPAVPDAFGTREGEHPQYVQGWNECRAEMLKGKP